MIKKWPHSEQQVKAKIVNRKGQTAYSDNQKTMEWEDDDIEIFKCI